MGSRRIAGGRFTPTPHNVAARRDLLQTLTYVVLTVGQTAEARQQVARGLAMAKQLADEPGATPNLIYSYAWLAVTVEPTDLQDPRAACRMPQRQRRSAQDWRNTACPDRHTPASQIMPTLWKRWRTA